MAERDEVSTAICKIIRMALPEAEEGWKWNGPNFAIDGQDLITLSERRPVRIVFHRGAKARDTKTGKRLIEDAAGHLRWATDQRATIVFPDIASVKAQKAWLMDTCRRWVTAAK